MGLHRLPTDHVSPAPKVAGIPESFTAPGGPGCAAASSPFDEDAVPQTPNVRPSGPYGYQTGQSYAQGGNQPGANGRLRTDDQGLPFNRMQGLPSL